MPFQKARFFITPPKTQQEVDKIDENKNAFGDIVCGLQSKKVVNL